MKPELIGPTATLAAALLSKLEEAHGVFTEDIVSDAFADAYNMLLKGIQKVEEQERWLAKQQKTRAPSAPSSEKPSRDD